jgi:hypothetical protein
MARLLFCHFTIDDITQQINAVTLSGNANKSDAGNFTVGLFMYLLFIATNGCTDDIRSKADKDLKAWIMEQNTMRQSLPHLSPTDMQLHERIKVLDHIKLTVERFPSRQVEQSL